MAICKAAGCSSPGGSASSAPTWPNVATEAMSVTLLDMSGKTLYKTDLVPEG